MELAINKRNCVHFPSNNMPHIASLKEYHIRVCEMTVNLDIGDKKKESHCKLLLYQVGSFCIYDVRTVLTNSAC